MKSSPQASSVRSALVALALILSAGSSFAQSTVGSFIHGKIQNFAQTSSNAPVADAAQPFQFGSLLGMGTATINSATLTFSGSASPRSYTPVGTGDFAILDPFTTLAQLDAAYPTSTYNLSVDTSAGVVSKSITFFPLFGYPATTPRLTVPAGDWQSGVLVINPAADYTLTWTPFSGAQVTDLIQLIIGGSSLNLSPFAGTQTSYTIPAGSLQPNTSYVCNLGFIRVTGLTAADANFGAGYATLVKATSFTIHTSAPALLLGAAVSRKEHGGGAGTFDIPLPLTGTPAVECRTGGATGAHMLVFSFSNALASGGTAAVTGGTGSVADAAVSGNVVTVSLTGVTDAQTTTVQLSGVTDSFGQVLPDTAVSVGFLLGDTNGDRVENSGDALQTRARSGQALAATNFRSDVNADGTLNSGDSLVVRGRAGNSLP